jgi:hypothetical protein
VIFVSPTLNGITNSALDAYISLKRDGAPDTSISISFSVAELPPTRSRGLRAKLSN